MKVAATKTMTNTIRENLRDLKLDYCVQSVTYGTVDIDTYKRCIDADIWRAYDHGDIITDPKTGMNRGRYIMITYKSDCYAMPKTITTADILKELSHTGRTWEGLMKALYNIIAI